MTNMTDVKIRLNFWRSAYEKLTAAYTALVEGRVKSYTIDDRQLTRFDLGTLKDEIEEAEQKIDELRRFESDYRTRLKSYLQNLLTNVEDGGESSISGL